MYNGYPTTTDTGGHRERKKPTMGIPRPPKPGDIVEEKKLIITWQGQKSYCTYHQHLSQWHATAGPKSSSSKRKECRHKQLDGTSRPWWWNALPWLFFTWMGAANEPSRLKRLTARPIRTAAVTAPSPNHTHTNPFLTVSLWVRPVEKEEEEASPPFQVIH